MKSGMKIIVTIIIAIIVILVLGIITNVIRNNIIMKKLYENSSELKTSIKNYYYEKNLNYQKEKLEQLHIKYTIIMINT